MTRSDGTRGEVIPPGAYVARHKTAFRTAFDFLNAHFPPGSDGEWWCQVTTDMLKANDAAGADTLVGELLSAVFNYLDDEFKIRRNDDGADDH